MDIQHMRLIVSAIVLVHVCNGVHIANNLELGGIYLDTNECMRILCGGNKQEPLA